MRILVTNDDGLHAPGLLALATATAAAGHDVLAVAPEGNHSGASSAIGDLGAHASIRCRDMPLAGLPDVQSVEFDAPPALCVIATCLGAFGDVPDLVLSGVNPGLNTGRVTLHSGTVGAALTAANFGLSAVAVSIDGDEPDVRHWGVAAELAVECGEWAAAAAADSGSLVTLNLSVPDRPRDDLREPAVGSLAPKGTVHTEVLERTAERLELGFRVTEAVLPEGSDSRLAAEGHVVLTPITGIRATTVPGLDGLLATLKSTVMEGER